MNRRDLIKFLSATAITPLLPWQKQFVLHMGWDLAKGPDMSAITVRAFPSTTSKSVAEAMARQYWDGRVVVKSVQIDRSLIAGEKVSITFDPEMDEWVEVEKIDIATEGATKQ